MTYDQILDEVARGYLLTFEELLNKVKMGFFPNEYLLIVISEAAERYRAQVDLPSDEEIIEEKYSRYDDAMYIQGFEDCAKWLRDHIKSQLNKSK